MPSEPRIPAELASVVEGMAEPMAGALVEALDNARIGLTLIGVRDGELVRIYANHTAAEIYGIRFDRLEQVPPLGHMADEDKPHLFSLARKWLAGEPVPGTVRTRVLRDDGERVPVEIAIATVRHGSSPLAMCFVRDLSAQERMAEALRASEARFRTLAESAPDSIAVSVRGRFVYVNPATARVLGYDGVDALLGQPVSMLLTHDEGRIMAERIQRIVAGEQLPPREYQSVCRDGSLLSMEISSMSIEWEGQPAILAIGRDITERKRIQGELIQADRMATVGMLAAGVAHEINNPLTYVLLHLHRLQELVGELSAPAGQRGELSRLLSEALHGSERVRNIVKDLLSFSRAETAKEGPIEVSKVIESALKLASTTMPKHTRVTCEFAAGLRPVDANEARLGQVFLNLIVNAVQSFGDAPAADCAIRISARNQDGWVVIEIDDNGSGIPDDDLEHVFTPFFTTQPIGHGTGLGLPITRSIVTSLGGAVELRNLPDGGARAHVRLPASAATSVRVIPPPRSAPGPAARRVLVIDDDAMVARALAALLSTCCRAEIMVDGLAAAEALLADTSYDAVFCDINMPNISGMDLYDRVTEANPGYRDRFIFITGGALTPRATAFVARHDHRVLDKPFDIDQVFAVLDGVC